MDSLTIKELVLEIVEEILSSEEDLQELFGRQKTRPGRLQKRRAPSRAGLPREGRP